MAFRNIFQEMENFRREIDETFRSLGMGRLLEAGFLQGLEYQQYLPVNLSEDENHVYVQALVPGLEPNDIDLNVIKGTLTLSGERKEEERAGGIWHRRERGSGRFLRNVELPVEVDMEKVSAECQRGVLTITLPKAETAKPKKITVRTS
jgi:HSP20 family protein